VSHKGRHSDRYDDTILYLYNSRIINGGQENGQVCYVFVHGYAAQTKEAISTATEVLDDLGNRITQVTDYNHEITFLYQRLSVIIQRYISRDGHPGNMLAHTIPKD